MTTALHLAKADDLERLLPMVTACHEELERGSTDAETLQLALSPLLEGAPHGAIYLLGMSRAPIGYASLSFGWSLMAGGLVGMIDEIWVRPGVRRRGIGTEVLGSLPRALSQAGLSQLTIEVPADDEKTRRLYHLAGFRAHGGRMLMSRRF